MKFEPLILEGELVRLEPLAESHLPGLCEAIQDGRLWRLYLTRVPHPEHIRGFLSEAQGCYAKGEGLAFATIDKKSGRIAGSTRFLNAQPAHQRVEIGFTFLGRGWQRSGLNTEAKLLMLTHAFERLGAQRVEFLTDFLNRDSRRAIARLGAKEEGLLRNHMLMPDGRVRDSVLFSIIASEWSGIKQHLSYQLAQPARAGAHNAQRS